MPVREFLSECDRRIAFLDGVVSTINHDVESLPVISDYLAGLPWDDLLLSNLQSAIAMLIEELMSLEDLLTRSIDEFDIGFLDPNDYDIGMTLQLNRSAATCASLIRSIVRPIELGRWVLTDQLEYLRSDTVNDSGIHALIEENLIGISRVVSLVSGSLDELSITLSRMRDLVADTRSSYDVVQTMQDA